MNLVCIRKAVNTLRTGAIESVIENYKALIEAFQEISTTAHDDYGRRAGGVLAQKNLRSFWV